MATATAFFSVDMESARVWNGTVTIANANQIQVADGGYVQNYFGSGFTYSGSAVVGGTVTSTNYFEFGNKVYEITGGAYSAVTVANYVNSGNIKGLFSYAFAGNDVFNGSLQADVINGYAGNDVLYGNGGDDTLIGGAGADVLDGGAGINTASYANASGGVSADLGIGGYGGDATGDTYINIERIIGSNYDDVLVGVPGKDNDLIGGAGNDTIYGEGTFLDLVDGGAGYDIFFGGQGGALNLNVGQAHLENVWGSYDSDIIDGSSASWGLSLVGQGPTPDTLRGGSGSDFIYFRNGDTISGETVGVGNSYGTTDWAVATLSTSGVVLNLNQTLFEAAWGSGSNDVLTARFNGNSVILIGDAGNDTLTGGNATDFLYGFGGNDRLEGEGGSDVLVGDGHGGLGGQDTFFFRSPRVNLGADQIFYFVSGEDRLEFVGSDYGMAGGTAIVSGQNFISGPNPIAAIDRPSFLYDTANGLLTFDQDGNLPGQGFLVAQFYQAVPVAAGDFVIV